jgi:hypothetical protein
MLEGIPVLKLHPFAMRVVRAMVLMKVGAETTLLEIFRNLRVVICNWVGRAPVTTLLAIFR